MTIACLRRGTSTTSKPHQLPLIPPEGTSTDPHGLILLVNAGIVPIALQPDNGVKGEVLFVAAEVSHVSQVIPMEPMCFA